MPPTSTKLVVGYFPGWAIHARNYHVSDIPADKLTHINYAFAGISANGEDCISISPLDDQINFPALQLLKQQRPDLRTLISVGGASNSTNFSIAAKKSTTRTLFAQSCVSFMKASGFDGVDIDWEFPAHKDMQNYTELLKELRNQLDIQGTADSKHYLLTAALPAGPDQYVNFELNKIHQNLDWVNLMAYNFYTASSGGSGRTNFAAPLYPSSSDPETDPKKRKSYNVDAAVKAYLFAGVPSSKIVVGVPFFGQGWEGVPNNNNGLYQTPSGPAQGTWGKDGIFDFEDLNSNYVGTYQRFWGAEASVPWLYNPITGIMISYEDPQSAGLKANYVNANNLAGMMIWQLSADDGKFSLLNALASVLNKSPEPAPILNTALTSSARRIPKATYVPLKLEEQPNGDGRAIIKFGFLGNLSLQPGEVEAAREKINADSISGTEPVNDSVWNTLQSFEDSPTPSQLPSPSAFMSIPTSFLKAFGRAIVSLRQQAMETAPKTGSANMMIKILHNAATVATKGFEANVMVTPIGMLNLERLEMTPAGIQRGELIATIPLAPLEQTAVVHKEWSVTSKEFTSIVTDSLENYSETGVTENTELAQSTTSQTSHSNQFNINATVSGSYGPVTATVASAFSAQDQSSNSATESRKHAISTTRKASARVKQEHKVTISTTTVTGTSETSTRMLQNPSNTDPMRIDYFSIMRKWHVGLYRYGLRLTYDIAIPEPGATMRRLYAQIDELKKKIGPFHFDVTHEFIASASFQQLQELADQMQTQLPLPPQPKPDLFVHTNPPNTPPDQVVILDLPPLNVTDGYWITQLLLSFHYETPKGPHWGKLGVVWTQFSDNNPQNDATTNLTPYFLHEGGQLVLTCRLENLTNISIGAKAMIEPTQASISQWNNDVWNALYNAAQTQYYAKQQDLQAQITALEDKINNVDTLTLRREESEEIMKGVLRWLLGPTFDFMPNDVIMQYINAAIVIPLLTHTPPTVDLEHGATTDIGDGLAVTAKGWLPMLMYEEMVKFINEAIEWENVLYFLYSYFWDVPPSWNFIRQIKHPDATRQAFLRSGSARVVLTVRKGWEEAWVTFVEAGGFGETLIPNHPYMSIAKEIQNYDEKNYPGIPPANPGGDPLPDSGESVATASSGLLNPGKSVTFEVKSSKGFIVGYTAIIDSYDSKDPNDPNATIQEKQTITAVPDNTHLTVERIDNLHDGSKKPFVVMQGGEKGQLIAEWFEYTPTSGTDIAVTSNLTTIA